MFEKEKDRALDNSKVASSTTSLFDSVPGCFPDELLLRVICSWQFSLRSDPQQQSAEEVDISHSRFRPFTFPTVEPVASLALCCGLLLRLRSAYFRVSRRHPQLRLPHLSQDSLEALFACLVQCFCSQDHEEALLVGCYSGRCLWRLADELTRKAVNLSPPLQRELYDKRLRSNPTAFMPLTEDSLIGLVDLDAAFLNRVREYHRSVQRPDRTFELAATERIRKLAALPRETCASCRGKRQVYCGPCGGRRMAQADLQLLPSRVELPFDVLLLLHWNESLAKCTGIHSAVLSTEGSVKWMRWNKDKTPEDWQEQVGRLDPLRDVLLFPSSDAVPIESFHWAHSGNSNIAEFIEAAGAKQGSSAIYELTGAFDNSRERLCSRKWRLVVLEANWRYAKTMAMQISDFRRLKGLPAIPCVALSQVTGQYWRFHDEGHSSLSTIEAITHAACSALTSCSEETTQSQQNHSLESSAEGTKKAADRERQNDDLVSIKSRVTGEATNLSARMLYQQSKLGPFTEDFLILFNLQMYRVFRNVEFEGGRLPKAVEVCGTGLGSWKELTDILEGDESNSGN